MSKKDELQAQRNELFNHSEDTLARIKELDKAIADESKPKLRHGDYGFSLGVCDPRLVVGEDLCIFGVSGDPTKASEIKNIIGNIFDDLTAQQEDVTLYSLDVHTYKINTGKGWGSCKIHIAGNNHTIEEAEELSMKLRQIIATAKRKESSNGQA